MPSAPSPSAPSPSAPSPRAVVWPKRTWALKALSEAQYEEWVEQGYLVVENALDPDACAAAAAAIRQFIGADDTDRHSWYKNTADIYSEVAPCGSRPLHGPCGMVQLYHHRTLWHLRQSPLVHAIFADLYGTVQCSHEGRVGFFLLSLTHTHTCTHAPNSSHVSRPILPPWHGHLLEGTGTGSLSLSLTHTFFPCVTLPFSLHVTHSCIVFKVRARSA